jgi:GNAT superfamily N-acetyltransferase
LKKKIRTVSDICGKLQFETVRGIGRLQFLLLEYSFFKTSEGNSALPVSMPWFLCPVSFVLHIVKSHALILIRLPCYFVKLKTKVIGLWAIQELHESLLVASLGVAKEYRRLGIGTYILSYIEAIAKRMGKKWLEVDVLKKNIAAQQFYTKYGFTFIPSERAHDIVRGKKPL